MLLHISTGETLPDKLTAVNLFFGDNAGATWRLESPAATKPLVFATQIVDCLASLPDERNAGHRADL
jgi:hypothetical protein